MATSTAHTIGRPASLVHICACAHLRYSIVFFKSLPTFEKTSRPIKFLSRKKGINAKDGREAILAGEIVFFRGSKLLSIGYVKEPV
jgi:hypothetical protein